VKGPCGPHGSYVPPPARETTTVLLRTMAAPNGRAVAGSGLEFIKWGLPMVVLVVSAPFGLSYLTQEKITQHDLRTRIKKEDEANVFGERRLFNLEEEYFVRAYFVYPRFSYDLVPF